jgi:hypothetical protein
VYVCRLASQVSALGLYLVIKHRSEDKLNANTRSNQYTRYGTQKHRSDLYYYEKKEPDTKWMQIWNNIRWLQEIIYELLQNAPGNTKQASKG